ncbi:MAG TPA: DUF2231 domain-containing protein [Actinomycetota bacterium]|nr:DUF2231 domain-containing protein [Actinomycetota bacterium]
MAIKLRHTSPTGETRMWTLVEMAQGKPIERPIHPMLVHFPIAFTYGALGLDILSRLGDFPAAPIAATWLVVLALLGFAGAALVGFADRAAMSPGVKIRRVATRHAIVQISAALVVVVNLLVRWSDRHVAESDFLWIALGAIATVVVSVGADIGGRMVYAMGWRPGRD